MHTAPVQPGTSTRADQLKSLQVQLARNGVKKKQAVALEDYDLAKKLKGAEQDLQASIAALVKEIAEHADDVPEKQEAPPTPRERVLAALESGYMSFVILALVLMTVAADLSQTATELIMWAFFLECSTRMWAMGVKLYFLDIFCALDVALVVIDVACWAAASATKFSGARLLRLVRIMKFFKFIRLLKGMRCVRAFYRNFLASKGPAACNKPGVFALWLDAMDADHDGFYDLKELSKSFKDAHIVVSQEHLSRMFDEIYDKNAGLRQMFDDSIDTLLDDEDKKITTTELEEYIRTIHPMAHDERILAVAYSFTRSFECWAVFGGFIANIIKVFGNPWIGPLQSWNAFGWRPDYVVEQFLQRSLGVVADVGFLSLFYSTATHTFDSMEMAEKTLVGMFEERERQAADMVDDSDNDDDNGGMADADMMNIDGLREMLQKKKIHISDHALLQLFKKIDTSTDMLVSHREILAYVEEYRPATRQERALSVAGEFFSIVGVCLMAALVGGCILFGNDFLWSKLAPETKDELGHSAIWLDILGGIGWILLQYSAETNQFEACQNARHTLLCAVQEEANWNESGHQKLDAEQKHDGDGISGLFYANQGTSAAEWVRSILGGDQLLPQEQYEPWCQRIEAHKEASHIKYFSALLELDGPMVATLTEMPVSVICRLQKALTNEHEGPWRTRTLDVQTLQSMLAKNHILIPTFPMESLFNEVDADGTGRISKHEFDDWMNSYRPLKHHEKRALVIDGMLHSSGFWNLAGGLLGTFALGVPIWAAASSPFSGDVGVQISRTLGFFAGLENMMQVWRSQAHTCDAYEHSRLELKSSVGTIQDLLELDVVHADRKAAREKRRAAKKAAREKNEGLATEQYIGAYIERRTSATGPSDTPASSAIVVEIEQLLGSGQEIAISDL